MNPEEQALIAVMTLLGRFQIPFMLTGAVAASYHGRPRATHDADIVIDPNPQQLDDLVSALDAGGFYVDRESAMRALGARTQFNAIETAHACKIDLIVRRDRPFSEQEFRRRMEVDFPFAARVPVVTPEDAILSKLEWARAAGDPERQLADAAGVLELNPDVDYAYIEYWAQELGVLDLWTRMQAP